VSIRDDVGEPRVCVHCHREAQPAVWHDGRLFCGGVRDRFGQASHETAVRSLAEAREALAVGIAHKDQAKASQAIWRDCAACGGRGDVGGHVCSVCDGVGQRPGPTNRPAS
jgi:hypothetical protein